MADGHRLDELTPKVDNSSYSSIGLVKYQIWRVDWNIQCDRTVTAAFEDWVWFRDRPESKDINSTKKSFLSAEDEKKRMGCKKTAEIRHCHHENRLGRDLKSSIHFARDHCQLGRSSKLPCAPFTSPPRFIFFWIWRYFNVSRLVHSRSSRLTSPSDSNKSINAK